MSDFALELVGFYFLTWALGWSFGYGAYLVRQLKDQI